MTYRIFSLLTVVCCLFTLASCSNEETRKLTDAGYSVPIGETKTAEEFTAILGDLGYEVQDDTEIFAEQLEMPLKAYISASDEHILYEYIICEDAENARQVYFNKVSDLDSEVTSNMFTLNSATKQYVKDIYDNDEIFTCIALVNDTILLAVAESDYSEDINKAFQELGY